MSVMKQVFETLLKVLYPSRCKICGEVIELDELYCEACKNPPVIKAPLCINCGASKSDCTCRNHKMEYKQIVAPYYYTDRIIVSVHRFKDAQMLFIGKTLASAMSECIRDNYCNIDFDFITFVPLRKFHERIRGFNQAQLLADLISEHISVPAVPLLSKIRYTGVQHHKNRQERAADVFGSYDVIDEYKYKLDDKTILLIDDVKTTGSTLNECAKMLKIYGAKEVYCVAAAITKYHK